MIEYLSGPADAPSGSGRRALVTGAGSGIGRATALRLAGAGYELVLLDRDAAAVATTAAAASASASVGAAAFGVDLQDRAAITSLTDQIDPGSVDLLVNCAGVGWAADTQETSDEQWDATIGVNLTATFRMCRMVLPGMLTRERGVIVNVASAGALVGLKRRVAYCASKAGVLGLTRAIAADYAGAGIRIIAVCPGTVDSPWIGRMIADEPDPEAVRRRMADRQLDGRMGTPEEVAEWIEFVSSDRGRFMNGAALVIDGGLTAV